MHSHSYDYQYLFVPGRFGNGATGSAEYVFDTGSPPTGGECHVITGTGVVRGHDVLNTLMCDGWTSSAGSTDLIYDYFYKTSPNGTEYMVQYTRDAIIRNIRLPLGLQEYNYTLYMKAVISDRMGTRSEARFEYQVTLQLDEIIIIPNEPICENSSGAKK